jgi:hypothetical protein
MYTLYLKYQLKLEYIVAEVSLVDQVSLGVKDFFKSLKFDTEHCNPWSTKIY